METAVNHLEPALFADGFLFLEAPKWQHDELWVSDVFDHKVYALSSVGQRVKTIEVANRPSGLGFLSDGSLIIASAKDRKLLRFDGCSLGEYADLSNHAAAWLNDFAVDPQDRIYVGDFGYDFVGGEARKLTNLHRVDADRSISKVASGLDFPNGSVVINQGRTLIVAETWEARLTAFDIDDKGQLSNRRVFADLHGRQPDGICADAEGAIWAGIYNTGEFIRVLDGGRVTHRVAFDGSGISCTIGGPEGRTLFMTVFVGTNDDIAAGKRNSAVFTVNLEIGNGVRP